MTGRQFQAHFAMDGKYAPTAPQVLTRSVHLMLFHCALTGTTPSSGDLWPLSGGGKWPRDPATEIYISFDLITPHTHTQTITNI